jgi:hypothetical protein
MKSQLTELENDLKKDEFERMSATLDKITQDDIQALKVEAGLS